MKKIFIILAVLLTSLSVAQEESNYDFYLASGLSVTNSSNFSSSSYASVELGVMKDNVSFGAVLGRNNLENIGENESLNNYWYEGKLAFYFPLGKVDGYALGGVGSYIENESLFLEYGVGVSKKIGVLSYFIQLSNWDTVNYISGGFSIPLN